MALWLAAAAATAVYLPGLGSGEALELGGLIPDDSPAIQAGERSQELFSVPLTADTAVVERAPEGFSQEEQEAIVQRAVDASSAEQDGDAVRFALPILNTRELFPGSEEDGTTAVTHLFFPADVSLTSRVELAREYRDQAGDGHYAGVTGPGPARLAQFEEIENALPLVELGTVLAIALVVGLTFRSLGAPLLTLVASGIAFLVAGGAIPWVAEQLGAGIPQEVEPLVVALTLGIVTDYTIFFLSACRRELARGTPRLEAARRSCTAVAPIVATAGLIVVTGTAALVVGELEFFRAFGPALALTAAISLAVSITFVPASLALFGRLVFWPSLRPGKRARRGRGAPLARPLADRGDPHLAPRGRARRAADDRRPRRGGERDPPHRARPAARQRAPLRQRGAGGGRRRRPGVRRRECSRPRSCSSRARASPSARTGSQDSKRGSDRCPASRACSARAQQPAEAPRDVLVSEDGNAARIVAILDDPPLDSEAIETSQALGQRLPGLRPGGRPGRRDRCADRADGDRLRHRAGDRGQRGARRRGRPGVQLPPARTLPARPRRAASTCSRRACSPSRRPSA